MGLSYIFICPLKNGLHARPASNLEEVASLFESNIQLEIINSGKQGNVKSVLSIVSLDIKYEDECQLIISGPDQDEAFSEMKRFIDEDFPECDEEIPVIVPSEGEILVPPSLRAADIKYFSGVSIIKGMGEGSVEIIGEMQLRKDFTPVKDNYEKEQLKFNKGLSSFQRKIKTSLKEHLPEDEKKILKLHYSISKDPELIEFVTPYIEEKKTTVAEAINRASEYLADKLYKTGNPILQERAMDIKDVCYHILLEVYGGSAQQEKTILDKPTICVAKNLTPSQFLSLDKKFLKGLVLGNASTTSHTIILARSFNIPTLTGIENIESLVRQGSKVILDSNLGILLTKIDDKSKIYYAQESRKHTQKQKQFDKYAKKKAYTSDKKRIEVAANIGTLEELHIAMEKGAEGVGLFRTEMLFMDRDSAPSEEEQFNIYKESLHIANNNPVIIRTIDIGGDKPVSYMNIEKEENPFLGFRAVRLYPEYIELFTNQLRAIIRASAFGKVKLLIPMISCLDEIKWVKNIVLDIQNKLEKENIEFDSNMQLGIMVEIPSVAFNVDPFCDFVDFFSIGTNDLTQYFFAVDRGNKKVAHLYNSCQPAFLNLMNKIVNDAHKQNKWVGVCGEMAGDITNLPLLVGMGVDELSLSAQGIKQVKSEINKLSSEKCKSIIDEASTCSNIDEVEEILKKFSNTEQNLSIFDEKIITIDSDASSKEEAIKEIVDNFYMFDRAPKPELVEEAVWRRESTYSTGFGYGFAIPHCKTNAIVSNSIGILKLKNPVEWGSLDGKPVGFIILLAMRDSNDDNSHMKIFAQLAKKVMDDDFREKLNGFKAAKEMLMFLERNIETHE